jgi:hypothetical protein
MLIYTHCWELMNSVGSHGSLSLPCVMKVMVCHFVSGSHEVMTALIVVLPLIVVVEISLQLHRSHWRLDLVFRIEDAITLLEEMLEVKEEKLGTMHPDVQDDRQCWHELLNQQGRITSHKKSRKLAELLSNARKVFQTSK